MANIVIFAASVISCWLLGVVFDGRRIFTRWEPLRAPEQLAALSAVVLNSVVSVVGWMDWKAGYLEIRDEGFGRAMVDYVAMIVAMDLGMYLFHRIAYIPWFGTRCSGPSTRNTMSGLSEEMKNKFRFIGAVLCGAVIGWSACCYAVYRPQPYQPVEEAKICCYNLETHSDTIAPQLREYMKARLYSVSASHIREVGGLAGRLGK